MYLYISLSESLRELTIMGTLVDIDKVLSINDLIKCLDDGLQWPWEKTHFILAKKCLVCKNTVDAEGLRLIHFSLAMNRQDIQFLLKLPYIWCTYCNSCLYDHYPTDECEFCHSL